jgi:hypothetical protein
LLDTRPFPSVVPVETGWIMKEAADDLQNCQSPRVQGSSAAAAWI